MNIDRQRTTTKLTAKEAPAPVFSRTKRVCDLMARDVVTIAPHTLAVHAERLAASRGIHHLPVVESGELVGVVCLCDLWSADTDAVAAELMSSPPATIDSLAPAEEAADAMLDLAVGCLPVLDGDRLVGVLTRGDLRRAGVLDTDTVARTCASCGGRHHVRAHGDSKVSFCVSCLERGAAFDHPSSEEDEFEWE